MSLRTTTYVTKRLVLERSYLIRSFLSGTEKSSCLWEAYCPRSQESHCVLKDECDCIILEFVNTVVSLSFEYFIAKVVSLKRCSYLNFKSFTDEEVGGVAEAMLWKVSQKCTSRLQQKLDNSVPNLSCPSLWREIEVQLVAAQSASVGSSQVKWSKSP